MPLEAIRVSSPLPASAARVYAAWLDSLEHTRMTGGPATVDAKIGGRCSAWDGYIEGEILELEPGQRIVQSWRSREFPEGHAPSLLEIRLRDTPGGCEIWIAHSEIPEGQSGRYEAGWHEHYFIPMTKYFQETGEGRETPRTDPQELAPVDFPIATPAKPATKPGVRKGAVKRASPRMKAAKPKAASTGTKKPKAKSAAKKVTSTKAKKAAAKKVKSAKAKKAAKPAKKANAKKAAKPAKKASAKRSAAKAKPGSRRPARS
jgi:uncharacterized protein YndB with AHSA1/START domain